MTEAKIEKQQVNVDFTNFPELLKGLDEIVQEEMSDRSKTIRRLVQQEIARRQQLPLPFEESKPKKSKVTAPVAA